ncbi:dicarboxylate/amino acid:cation symporter [candidate division KSB1 bacterium]|nr:dicarboxylate/amino acid:cation symporter [candidate division KSB1 bacterium]
MSDSENTSLSHYQRYRKLSLGVKILIYLAMGILLGIVFGEKATVVQPLGDLFIRLLLMAAIPLVFFNLLAGLTSLEDIRALGRVGSRIAIYYVFTTVMALTLGLSMMHLLKPGVGMQLTGEVEDTFGQVPGVTEVLLDLIPENIFKAFSAGQMSQIVVFAVFLGITTLLMPKEKKQSLGKVFDVLAELFRKLVDIILHFSPIGIGALAASTVGQYGSAIFGPLALFIGGVWGAQAVMVIIYLLLLFLFTRQSPLSFFKQTAPLYATTAATCSSLASLVVSLEVAEDRVKLPRSIYSFTLPLGAQMNKDGTSIMLAGVLLFTAQAAGVEFSLASQATIILIGLLLSNGSGGIPGGGLVIALIFVKAFHLPLEIAVIVGGIYRLIDMGGTTINCMGDMVGTIIVAHLEEKQLVRI